MRINFTARHYKAPDKLRDYAESKVKSLEKYFDRILECEILLDYEKQTQIVEIALKVPGQRLFVIEKSEDTYKAIDEAVDKLERQVKKYKAKLRNRHHEKAPDLEGPEVFE